MMLTASVLGIRAMTMVMSQPSWALESALTVFTLIPVLMIAHPKSENTTYWLVKRGDEAFVHSAPVEGRFYDVGADRK